MSITPLHPVLDEALVILRGVVANLAPGDGQLPTPCEAWSVTQVVQHAAGDQVAWAAVVGGGPFPAEDPFAPSGQLAVEPTALVEESLARAEAAWGGVAPDAPEVPTPLPTGPMSASLAAAACALDAAVHAWDIAVASGQPSPLTADLAARLRPAADAIAEPLRGFAFAAAVPAEPEEDAAEALLRHLGRDPHWKP
jgi:uncharacterized protein (TIGR03086 family)